MSAHRLAIVLPEQELKGSAPAAFERLCRTSAPHSLEHVGVLSVCLTLTVRAIARALPPSAQAELRAGVDALTEFLRRGAPADSLALAQVKEARANCFQALPVVEKLTTTAVEGALKALKRSPTTLLDEHADQVVIRFARLSAHHATAALCHSLDAALTPEVALQVLADSSGARAYQGAGLGAARHQAFRQSAVDQATWEAAGQGRSQPQHSEVGALAIQIFHEYLGARWKTHGDEEAAKDSEFLAWALSSRRP